MTNPKVKTVVWGGSGFVGGELMRLLVGHPHLELAGVLSGSQAGKRVGEVLPGLAPWTDLQFTAPQAWDWDPVARGEWLVFAALPHRETMKLLPPVLRRIDPGGSRLIDLSGDFRLPSVEDYQTYYGEAHLAPDWLPRFVYGLPEANRSRLRRARYVASPGCFATGAQLAILPAAQAGAEIEFIALDGKTGSSGAGATPSATTHHPRRMNNYSAYSQFGHRHFPEILGGWRSAGGRAETEMTFVPQRAPMVRGIFTTAHLLAREAQDPQTVKGWYDAFYDDAPFVRVVEGSPYSAEVWGTNRCDLSVSVKGRCIVVCTAIDNLVKGAAGQAVQSANLLLGWEETTGLLTPPPGPV